MLFIFKLLLLFVTIPSMKTSHNNSLVWHIGKVTIHQVIEMYDNELIQSIIPKATTSEIQLMKWLQPHFATKEGSLKTLVQSFVIQADGKNILIDTCNGNDKDRPNVPTWSHLQTLFLENLAILGLQPTDIDVVACTHLHFDHVGWNTYLKDGQWHPTFPNAQYLFSKKEYEYWQSKPEKEMIDDFLGVADSVDPIIKAGLAHFIEDDHRINAQISCIPTPGHTPHHISIAIESDGKKALITGDILHHPCQIEHQDWTTLSDTFPEQSVETRRDILTKVADTDTLIIGSHFANPVAGKVITTDTGTLQFKV